MRRISIRTLMAFVLVSAVGLAALRNANELWAGMMLLVAMAALGGAVLGLILMRGRERAWWLGFVQCLAGATWSPPSCPIGVPPGSVTCFGCSGHVIRSS